MSSQFNGLLVKNMQLMGRQKGSLICQIITPLFCLGFIALIKMIVESQINKTGLNLKVSMPILFNIPIYSKFQYANEMIKISTCEEWYLYSFGEKANDTASRNYFGINTGEYNINTTGIINKKTGIIQSKCENISRLSPYFTESNYSSLQDDLYSRLEDLNKLDFNQILNESSISSIPDGAIQIEEINDKIFSYKLQINDNRLPPYHRGNGVTKMLVFNPTLNAFSPVLTVANGMVWASDLFNRAYFRNFFDDVVIVSGVQMMPYSQDDGGENIQRIINVAGSTFYPMAVSLLMPLFMYTIVLEKESKLIEIMKINGMKMRFYWLSNFTFNYILYAITMIIFNIFGGLILGLSLFTNTNFLLLFLVYFGWGFCQVGMAFFFQAFLSNARSATIIGYIISLWTTLLAVSLNYTLYDIPKKMPVWLTFYPSFNICRIFYYLTIKCGYETCISSFNNLDSELVSCLIVLFITPFIYIFLGIYLYEVIPQQFGVRKHPLFCVKRLFKKKRAIREKSEDHVALETDDSGRDSSRPSSFSNDDEVGNEVKKVLNINKDDRKKYPLIVDHLTKVYERTSNKAKPKRALNELNLVLNNNEIFGLLGPNGAGKTTFFSLLTGIYEPSSGNAWVGGHSIRENIGKVQESIGYCPQFDLLWGDLSVEEHLYFYSRLKNVKSDLVQKNVEKTLRDIKLDPFRNFLVRELSGGMKRRLSLGISIVGNPSIVFLDEPTTGLDPENKRQIWEILSECKDNKCMILTTHLMEEAEVLSDRIGIIVGGQLRCLGTQYKLKKFYGKGFKLVINLVNVNTLSTLNINSKTSLNTSNNDEFIEERAQNVEVFIKNMFPGATLHEKYKNTLIFEISNEEFDAEILFDQIEHKKDNLYINNWAISQVTLEDIFIKLTENDI